MTKVASAVIIGCGYVGAALGRLLKYQGAEVIAVRRSAAVPGLPAICCDVLQRETLHLLPQRPQAVFYLVSAEERSERAYRRAYVEGLQNVVDHYSASENRPGRFIFASSTGVYGQDQGEIVTEESPAENPFYTGAAVREGERILLSSSLPASVIRLAGIYGPGRARMLQAAAATEWPIEDDRWQNRIHRDDCAAALLHVAQLSPAQPLYNAVDDEPTLKSDVVRYFARLRRKELPSAACCVSGATGKRVMNAKLKASGYSFRFPTFREGAKALKIV